MRKATGLRLDPEMVEAARVKVELPEGTPEAAVIRYVLALTAGASESELADALDTSAGYNSVTRRKRREQQERIAAIAAQYGVAA